MADKFPDFVSIPQEGTIRRAKDSYERQDLLRYLDEPKRQYGIECWDWYGNAQKPGEGKLGYGLIWDGDLQKPVLAHRASWKVFKGNIPKGHVVSQTCENFRCTNPLHLVCGPRGKITGSRLRRNRKTAKFGDSNASSKFTEADVLKIRELHGQKDFETITKIAEERGGSREYAIALGRTRGRHRKRSRALVGHKSR